MKRAVLLVVLACAVPAAAKIIDGVAAVVDGRVVTLSEVEEAAAGRVRLGAPSSDSRKQALEGLIEKALIDKEAARVGIAVTDQEAESAAAEIRARNGMDEAAFRSALASQGMSWPAYLGQLRDQILKVKVAGQVLRSRLRPDDAELREFYLKHAADFCEPEQVRLKHLELPGDVESAEAARRRIEAGEAPEAVGRELGGGKAYGDMGVLAVGSLSEVVREAVKNASAGGVSPVVQLGGSCHIFIVADKKQGRVAPYEELPAATKDLVKTRYFEEKEDELYRGWIEGLKEKAKIERLGS